ncbi:hypothetical protein N8005_07275 [Litorivicinus sp.]|nr:hypothetical protein [Litorivicinus sp.]
MQYKFLILDFDGVIVDSAGECLDRTIDALSLEQSLSKQDLATFSQQFLTYRFLVGPPYEFYFLSSTILEFLHFGSDVTIPAEFNKFRESNSDSVKTRASEFEKRFFLSRGKAKADNKQEWFAKHRVYDEIFPYIASFKSENIFVASMKDEPSIVDLLDFFNIPVPTENIYGSSLGENKKAHLSVILESTPCVSNSEFLFLDDNPRHLLEVEDMGVSLKFASWGYGKNDGYEGRFQSV